MEEGKFTPMGYLGLVVDIPLILISLAFPAMWFLTIFALVLTTRVFKEYERGVLFTLGRYSGVIGPGIVFILPPLQMVKKVDLRVHTIDILPQEVITKDNVSIKVNGVVFYRVVSPEKAVLNVKDYVYATGALAQTVLRDVIGGILLDELLENREEVAATIRKIVDEKSNEWGIDITDIRLQDITLPENMKRAMAVEAEAARERRAVIIKAEGEKIAAANYAEAAKIISSVPGGITLRTLQTVNDISKDPSQKFYILLPIELLESWVEARKTQKKGD